MSKLRAISLFTGAGGLDLGFEAAGFETAVALELDARCVTTLRANRPWPVIDRDILGVATADLLSVGGLRAGAADVLIGGPPCQPFSKSGFWASGEAKRLDDPRAGTLGAYMRVLEEARPRAFLIENVEGLGFRGKDEGLRLITSELARINAAHGTRYSASIAVLNAADYGVPQLRRRLFVIGARDGRPFEFPAASHVDPNLGDPVDNRPPYRTAWDALHDVVVDEPSLALTGKWARLLPSIPEGQNYLWHTDRGGGLPLFGWRRRYWSFLLKLAKAQPAWTLQAQPGPATGPFHWSSRRLSMREMARLQTLPDDFVVTGTVADAQRQLGNAVPSLLGEVLARAIASQLLGVRVDPDRLALALRAAPPAPPPERVAKVPSAYLGLRGEHDAHPGTGKGYRASGRPASSRLAAE
ncbi:DNA cytosine methyltransferase [Xanthobacter sp. YC-JY1]|uniref:DNA cytosine methyltransferase n=1 Tax=Xanthobacter sp. YC-JY1 TaxID=2419844 RepID=UPI001F1900CE|nr:DNA cytosine methyltransferase [Xanthobacter sp. YC-JY1]UJX46297.1 DNA cytosine methyltransferase [Xanthobacter sp. YC-JY1]